MIQHLIISIYFKLEPQATGDKQQAAGALKLTQLNDIEEI